MAANSDISLSLDLRSFRQPTFEDPSLAYVDENGIHLFTGGDASTAVKSTPINAVDLQKDLNGIQKLVPQTLTLSYVHLHLVAGMTVNIHSNFATTDARYNDFSFAVLSGGAGPDQAGLMQDGKYFARNLAIASLPFGLTNAVFNGINTGQHFNVTSTGDYTLVLGVADANDKTGKTSMAVTDVSLGVPGSAYTITPGGLVLSDNTLLFANGLINAPNGLVFTNNVPLKLTPGSQGLVLGLSVSALNRLIANAVITAGGGLLNTNAGGTINPTAGGLPSLTTTTTVPGVGAVATNYSGLVNLSGVGLVASGAGNLVASGAGNLVASGAGNLIGQDGGGLISQDGGSLISQDGGGLISQDGGGLISQDGGGLISQDGGGLAATGGSATLVISARGGAGDNAFIGSGATATAIAYATAAVTRSYTLTGDPGVAPAVPPKAVGEVVVSDRADSKTQYTTPAVAALSDGRYVTVWSDNLFYQDNGGIVFHNGAFEIRGQLYSADGTKSGGVFDISEFAGVNQITPSVTGLANGRFVVTYTGVDLSLGRSTDIFAQFYNADGSKNGSRVPVNTVTSGDQKQGVVASLFGGGAVVVFRTPGPNGQKLLGQIYAADGTAQGGNFAVGPAPTSFEELPAVAGLQNGGFVVAYDENIGPGPEFDGIYAQRFNAAGVSQGAPVLVNTTIAGKQDAPGVATLTDGSYVVSWRSEPVNTGIGLSTIFAQRYSAAGATIGGEVTIATDASVLGTTPAITALHDGGYVIAWDAPTQTSNGLVKDVEAQVMSADGIKQGASFLVSPANPFNTFSTPAATTLADDKLLVVGVRNDGQVLSDIRADAFSFPTTSSSAKAYGRVLDGIIQGATVFADANGDGVFTPGEASAITDAFGRYTFATPASGKLVVTGGTDLSTGLPFTQTYTAPAGSLAVTALSTLVQKVMQGTGGTVAEAMNRVTLALGLPITTDLTSLNPITQVLNGAVAEKALLADAVLNDTIALASAAGATGDLYGKLATQITAAAYGTVDPTAQATIQGLGLSAVDALGVSILAQAGAALLTQRLAADAGDVRALVNDVTSLQIVQQGAEAAELKAATANNTVGPLVNKYTGASLAAQVAGSSAAVAGNPFEFAYTDVTTNTIGFTRGDIYSGPVAGLAKQYVWASDDKVALSATVNNVFIHGGTADDALQVAGGVNVLDGSSGSNFLVGSSAAGSVDTFFVDGRGGAVTWSTIVNFHPGDMATIFGFKAGTSTQPLTENEGAAGYKGLTLHSELGGAGTGVNASMTFAGISRATADAHFTISADTLNKGTAQATDYLLIQYNR